MIDLEKIKEKIKGLSEKYKDTKDSYLNERAYNKLGEGIEAVEEVRKLTQELSDKVNEGNVALEGTMTLVMRQRQQETKNISEISLNKLEELYNKKMSLIKKLYARITGNTYITLREGLNIIENTTEQIPTYVERLSEELSKRRGNLSEFRSELRGGIEKLVDERTPLGKDVLELEEAMENLEKEYGTLEKQRLENSSQGIKTNPEMLKELDSLELVLSESQERHSELKVRKDNLQNYINLVNTQIGKVGELINLLDETRDPVNLAKEFVEVHVPYVLEEIRTQKSQVRSLFGVNRTMNFLEGQAELAGVLNTRIKLAAEYLDGKVKQIRNDVISKGSIYSDEKLSLEKGKEVKKVQYEVIDSD